MKRHFAKRKEADNAEIKLGLGGKRRQKKQRISLAVSGDQDADAMAPNTVSTSESTLESTILADPAPSSSFLAQLKAQKEPEPPKLPSQPSVHYESTPILFKPLSFNEPGKYTKPAARDAFLASLDPEIRALLVTEPPPSQEWWDQDAFISEHVYHPKEVPESIYESTIYLTSDEQRRKRKKERELMFAEARDRVKRGLDPPPPAKLKRSNVMAVIGSDYLENPTKYDQMALKAEQERNAAHVLANQERHDRAQTTKWDSHVQKVKQHQQQELFCACYKVEGPIDGKQKFLVDYTAKKFLFTGCCLQYGTTLILVEGGEKEVRKYDKLMKKINWTMRKAWQGPIKEPKFKKWSIHEMSEGDATKFLANFGCDGFAKM